MRSAVGQSSEQALVPALVRAAASTDALVVGGEVDRHLRLVDRRPGQRRMEGPRLASHIAAPAETTRSGQRQQPLVEAPARRGGHLGLAPVDLHERGGGAFKFRVHVGVGQTVGAHLPSVMVPRVQSDLMLGLRRQPQLLDQLLRDHRPRPERATQHDVPAVQVRRAASKHLHREGRLQHAPRVAAHVVGTQRDEPGGADPALLQARQQSWHAQSRAAEGVHVDAQADRHARVRACERLPRWRAPVRRHLPAGSGRDPSRAGAGTSRACAPRSRAW